MRKLNKKTIIFPEIIPFTIPDFENHNQKIVPKVLSFTQKNSKEWFEEFISEVESRIGKEFYPIMRLSDGEYRFIVGDVPPIYHSNFISYTKSYFMYLYRKLKINNTFKAATLPGVSSGTYTKSEMNQIMKRYKKWIKKISSKGVLALHLTYSKKSFQDRYHLHLKKWFQENEIIIHEKNYYPFYFVYALLRGNQRSRVLKEKRILIIHSAEGNKKEYISKSLYNEGVLNLEWLQISSSRSLFDKININQYIGNIDLVLLGAGVGKPNIMIQLEKLKVPCIDAGFVFEVWADNNNKWKRPIMVNDDEWDVTKVKFL